MSYNILYDQAWVFFDVSVLDDDFAGDGRNKVQVFRANRKAIEDFARKKYLARELEPDGSVLIRTMDFHR